ncbi:hypothetical protein [Pseudomonas cichorii]|nr:hypothetical protein [Pseudomonas cichorii]
MARRSNKRQAELPAPNVPVIIKDENGIEHPLGLLSRKDLNRDLELVVSPWDFNDELSTFVEVGWRVAGAPFAAVQRYRFEPPIDPGPKSLAVPLRNLEHGTHDLSYRIIVGGNGIESLKKTVTVDRVAPNDNQRPDAVLFPDELNGVITNEYLSGQGEVQVKVPLYTDLMARDRALYDWTDSNPPAESEQPLAEQEFSQEDIDNDRLLLTFSEAQIRGSGQGIRYAYYRLCDLAGNQGPFSFLANILVQLTPAPANLKPPRIPLSSRGLIDREHAREGATGQGGVTVEIDAYDNPEASQKILVDWDGTPLAELNVDPLGFPLQAYVPWSTLRAKGLGALTATVDYKVRYGALLSEPSEPATAPVDLTIAGQDHANAPALLNVNLAMLEVRGEKSDTPNTLTVEDHGLDAKVLLALYDDPHPGESIAVYWGAIPEAVASYEVKTGDVAGQLLTLVIPWGVIEEDLDNLALPVFYITHNNINEQQSRITDVHVSIVLIEGLKEPSFPHANLYGYLNCCAVPRLWKGVTVRIEGDPRFAAGDKIELAWQGCDSLNGTRPIPGVAQTFEKTLSADEALNGFETVVLPYDTLIAPMANNGSALVEYTLTKTAGGFGRSAADFVKITRTLPSGKVCSPEEDICEE